MKYACILADPPWGETLIGKFSKTRHGRPDDLPYRTLTLDEIKALPVAELAADSAHLWLWTTSRSLPDGFDVMRSWGFKYLNTVTWVKPSGFGAWWVNRTQVCLFGYRGKLEMSARYRPNVLFAPSRKHSQKPENSYQLIEEVSPGPYLELFARHRQNEKWTVAGDGVDGQDIRESLKRLTLIGHGQNHCEADGGDVDERPEAVVHDQSGR